MPDIVQTPVRSAGNPSSITNLAQMRPNAAFKITTKRGSVYLVYPDPNPNREVAPISSKAFMIVSKDGAPGYPQHSHVVINIDEPWEIHPGHWTSPIKSIERASVPSN